MEHFWPKKACDIQGRLEMVVIMMLSRSFCNNPHVRFHIKHFSICTNTLMNYLTSVSQIVERKKAVLLPDMFALIFDGCKSGTTHYLTIFSSKPLRGIPEAQYVLLAFSKMCEEESISEDEDMHCTNFVLSVYEKYWSNIGA